MVLFLTTTLVVSALGMAAILWLKRYELRTGHVFLVNARPAMNQFFGRGVVWLEEAMPAYLAGTARRAWHYVRTEVERGVAWAVILAEQGLIAVLRTLRRTTSAQKRGGEASPFLREVAEHKKKILEENKAE